MLVGGWLPSLVSTLVVHVRNVPIVQNIYRRTPEWATCNSATTSHPNVIIIQPAAMVAMYTYNNQQQKCVTVR